MALSLHDLPKSRSVTKKVRIKKPWQLPDFAFVDETGYDLALFELTNFEGPSFHSQIFDLLCDLTEKSRTSADLRSALQGLFRQTLKHSYFLSRVFHRGRPAIRIPIPAFLATGQK